MNTPNASKRSGFGSRVTPECEALWITLTTIAVFLLCRIGTVEGYKQSDPLGTLLLSQTIIRSGTVNLDVHPESVLNQYSWHIQRRPHGTFYTYPIGSAAISAPFVWAANRMDFDFTNKGHDVAFQDFLAPVTAALAFIGVYFLARSLLSFHLTLLYASLFTFGSAIVSTMGVALWNLNWPVVLELAVLNILVWGLSGRRNHQESRQWGLLIGLLLFGAYSCRPSTGLFILAIFAYLLVIDRRALIWSALSSGILFLALTFFSEVIYHNYHPSAYVGFVPGAKSSYATGLYGILFSPSRGLFVYSPFLLVSIFGLYWLWKDRQKHLLTFILLAWVCLHALVVAGWGMWWGGGSFGYRLLTDAVPGYFYVAFAIIAATKRQAPEGYSIRFRQCLVATACFAMYVHSVQGLFNNNTIKWHWDRDNIITSTEPHYHLNWRYPQFLADPWMLEERFEYYRRRNSRLKNEDALGSDE